MSSPSFRRLSRRNILKGAAATGAALALPTLGARLIGGAAPFAPAAARAAGTTTITSASLSPISTSYSTLSGDTFSNCWADDGQIYFTPNDTQGVNNQDSSIGGEKFFFGVLPNSPGTNPFTEINNFRSPASLDVGAYATYQPDCDGISRGWGSSGMYCQNGTIYLPLNRGTYGTAQGQPQTSAYGNVIYSQDHGRNWYNHLGQLNTLPDLCNAMFGKSADGLGFVPYFIEHGQNGAPGPSAYLADQYVYAADAGAFNNGSQIKLARVPRASIMDPTQWQWYNGPIPIAGNEGLTNSNWGSLSAAQPIFAAPSCTNTCEIRFNPYLQKYLMLGYYYPEDGPQTQNGHTASTVWTFFQSDTPWGPWSLFYTTSWNPQGFYLPSGPSKWMVSDGSGMWIIFAGDYANTSEYIFHHALLTFNTGGASANLLPNPGFESGSLGPWGDTSATVVSGDAYTGTYAAQLGSGYSGCYQLLTNLQPNTTYTLSGWIKAASDSGGAFLFVKDFGNGDQIVSPTITSTEYAFTILHFTTGNTTQATLGAWKSSGGVAFVDDVAVM